MRAINKVVIHHSAVEQPDTQKMLQSINRSHKSRFNRKLWYEWSEYIQYHYMIATDWEIIPLCDHKHSLWHASDFDVNEESLWILISGDLDKRAPYNKQNKSLYELLRKLDREYNFTIHLHREFADKSCPWDMFSLDMLDPENHTDLQTKLTGTPKNVRWHIKREYNQTSSDCTKYASWTILSHTLNKRTKESGFNNIKEYSASRWEPAGEWTSYILQWEITLDCYNKNNEQDKLEWLALPIVSEDTKKLLSLGYMGMISRKTWREIVMEWLTGIFKGKTLKKYSSNHASTIYFDFDTLKIVEQNVKKWVFSRNRTTYHSSMKSLIKRWFVKPIVIFYVKYE